MMERCIGCGLNIKKNQGSVERHGAVWCSKHCVDTCEKEEDRQEEALRDKQRDARALEKSEAFDAYQSAFIQVNDNCLSTDGTVALELWDTLQDALDAYIVVVARQDREGV